MFQRVSLKGQGRAGFQNKVLLECGAEMAFPILQSSNSQNPAQEVLWPHINVHLGKR
jgi:hypothetical protein